MTTTDRTCPRVLLLAAMLWALAAATACAATVLIDDFDNVSDWSNLALETTTVREGAGAGRWADTVAKTAVTKNFATPLDLSATTHMGFWLFSAVANGAKLQLVLDSENAASDGWDYYSHELTLDWTGWRWVWLSKEKDLGAARSPLGWHTINYIGFRSSGWGHTPAPDTNLVFDRMLFSSTLADRVVKDSAWVGPDYVYTYAIHLKEPDGLPASADVSCSAPAGLSVIVNPVHVDLPPNGSAVTTATVTIPAAVLGQGAYRTHELLFVVTGGGREEWRDTIANPPPAKPHPCMLLDQADFVRIESWAQTQPWAAQQRDSIVSRANSWRSSYLADYGLGSVALPPEGGQWGSHYVCPTHGVSLSYSPPMTHRCPIDNQTFTGWPYDQVIHARRHEDLAEAIRNTGLAYGFTQQQSYAQDCRELLLLYANAYNSYPIHDINGNTSISGARVLAQTLDESMWLVNVSWGYDLIIGSGVLTPAEDLAVQQNLLIACAEVIRRNDAGKSNWQAWHNAGIAAAGRATDDPSLTAHAINGRSGFHFHMAESVLSDGFWYESSWGYHFFTLRAMTYLAEMGARGAFPLYPEEPLHMMFTAPMQFAPPDLVLPAFNDSGTVDLRGYNGRLMEPGYRAYGDPMLAAPLIGSSRSEESLFWGSATRPTTAPLVTECVVFDGTGYAVMRGGSQTDPWYLALDYGEHGGWHGHYDKLGYVLYARGKTLGLDPGSHSYALPLHDSWDRSTPAHNTVTVDETDQAEATGTLVRFVNLPGSAFAHATGGNAYGNVDLRRSIVMRDGYVLDIVDARARDAQPHQADWFYHNPGNPSSDLQAAPYTAFPAAGGYQHLANNVAETTAADRRFTYSFELDNQYPGSIWKSNSAIQAASTYSRDHAHEGTWSNKLHYDFSAATGYITFRTKSMADYKEEVPTRVAVWVMGGVSGNRVRLRIVDATGESHVSPYTNLDFMGWREIRQDVTAAWSHWGGDNDGAIDLPLDALVLEVDHEGGAVIGDVYADDWRLTFPAAGEVAVENFERMTASERVWVKGQPGTTFVTGEGIGPNLLVPVPYVAVRREGVNVRFDALYEPYGDAPAIVQFETLACNAPPSDFAAGYRIATADWTDTVLLTGAGDAGTSRTFGAWTTDGTLAAVRMTTGGVVAGIAMADGSVLADGVTGVVLSPRRLGYLVFELAGTEGAIRSAEGDLTGVRIHAPALATLTRDGEPVAYWRDGSHIVIGANPAAVTSVPWSSLP